MLSANGVHGPGEGALNGHGDRRASLEKSNGSVCSLRRTIGIETEVIQRPPANGIRVLVLRERFRGPTQRGGGLIRSPGSVAISGAPSGSIIGNSRMIQRGVKPEIAHVDSAAQRHAEGLNRAIEILVIDRVLVMPNAGRWVRHFVGDEAHGHRLPARARWY